MLCSNGVKLGNRNTSKISKSRGITTKDKEPKENVAITDQIHKLMSIMKQSSKQNSTSSMYMLNHEKESDSHCDIKSCGLELGSSNKFKIMVKDRKLNRDRITQNFEDIFNDELGNKVFDRIKKGAKLNYDDELSGTKNRLTISPQFFQYNSQISVDDTVVPEKLEEILKDLVKSGENESDIKKISKFLEQLQPQIAEFDTFNELCIFFCKEKGILSKE